MNKKEIRAEMIHLISEQLGIGKDDVDLNATIDDLGTDSLDIIELVFAAEEKFDVEIPDDDSCGGKIGTMTVKEAADYILRLEGE